MAEAQDSRQDKKIASTSRKDEDDDSNLSLPSDEFSDSLNSEDDCDSLLEKQDTGQSINASKSPARSKTSGPRRSKRSNFGNRYEQAITKEKEDATSVPVRNVNGLLGAENDWGDDEDESEEDDTDFNPAAYQNGKDAKHVDGTEDESGTSSSDDDESNGGNSKVEPEAKKPPRGRKELLSSMMEQKRSIDDMLNELASSSGLEGVKICCICLWDEYDVEADAVVQCDSCGVPVHEACYGVLGKELEEVHAENSDAQSSTETMPWFCDPCRFGERDPVCIACPNKFGAFKQTVKGDWIHGVCARYIKEIYFQDEKRVSDVVTSSVPHSRWGDRPCVVCEDVYAKNAGITIQCETGMCKKSLHATCAMLVGSAAEIEQELGYPLAVYCPDHMIKEDKVSNRRCFLASLGIQRKHQNALKSIDDDERERLAIAEKKQREMYLKSREESNPELKPSVRPLHSAHSLIMKGHERSEALGHFSKPVVNPNPSLENLHSSRPDFRPEFVAYVHKREKMIVDYLERLDTAQNKRKQFPSSKNPAVVNKSKSTLKRKQIECKATQGSLSTILTTFSRFVDKKFLPEKTSPELGDELEGIANGESGSTGPRAKLAVCKTCSSSSFPQRMVQCDDCRARFHLKCLDPPLTTMPNRRHKGVKWQCSDCAPTEDDSEEGTEADTTEGRKRRSLQGKNPLREKRDEVIAPPPPAPGQKRRGRKPGFRPQKKVKPEEPQQGQISTKQEPRSDTLTASSSSQPNSQASKGSKGRKRIVEEDKFGVCVKCDAGCSNKDAVECDQCRDWYHFLTCLDPPYAKSPRSKFYGWICEECSDVGNDAEATEISD